MQRQQEISAIVVHGGAGAGSALNDGCRRAAEAGARVLGAGRSGLEAAIAAVLLLEDDERFNAGTGSALGLDGVTVEMDAAVMDSRGTLGAVAALQSVKNPVLVAHDVARTPHCLLAGEGAQRFARLMGHGPHDASTDRARRENAAILAKLAGAEPALPGADNARFRDDWNYASAAPFAVAQACDTVGAVVRDADGHFAVAASTGGARPALLGRVGDTPLVGCGFYAGPQGAVAATGVGEYMIRTMLASRVYHWIADGVELHEALRRGIALIPPHIPAGLIAVSRTQAGCYSNADMPAATI